MGRLPDMCQSFVFPHVTHLQSIPVRCVLSRLVQYAPALGALEVTYFGIVGPCAFFAAVIWGFVACTLGFIVLVAAAVKEAASFFPLL